VCGDLGSGARHAHEAARAIGELAAFPDFGADRPDGATDFNDLHQHRGAEAVERALANAKAPEVAKGHPTAGGVPTVDSDGPSVHLIRGDTIKAEDVDWCWPDHIAARKVNLLAGAGGTGKTTLTLTMAATITTGGVGRMERELRSAMS
jgi:putative DNA primase/helicase